MTTLIGFLGDTHGKLGFTLSAMRTAREAGARLMVQVGDFGADWPGKKKLHYGDRVQKEASRLGLILAFTRGNHDCTDSIAPPAPGEPFTRIRENIWHLDGAVLEWEGARIGFLGGATSSDSEWRLEDERRRRRPRSLWWPGEQVSREAAATLSMESPVDVFVSHDAPLAGSFLGLPQRSSDPDYLREAQLDREIITRTRAKVLKPGGFSFCGHWHERISTQDELGPLEMLGRDGDRHGALVILDPGTGILSPTDVMRSGR